MPLQASAQDPRPLTTEGADSKGADTARCLTAGASLPCKITAPWPNDAAGSVNCRGSKHRQQASSRRQALQTVLRFSNDTSGGARDGGHGSASKWVTVGGSFTASAAATLCGRVQQRECARARLPLAYARERLQLRIAGSAPSAVRNGSSCKAMATIMLVGMSITRQLSSWGCLPPTRRRSRQPPAMLVRLAT